MSEVEVRVEPSGVSGLLATGTYLIDAAARLGIRIPSDCGRIGNCDACCVTVVEGLSCLSEPTQAEINILGNERLGKGERLSCQAKLAESGEVVFKLQEEKDKKEEPSQGAFEEFRKEFYDMPLEKKVASLVELEAITLGEIFAFVINSPFKVFDLLIDVMAELGLRIEKQEKERKKPPEHRI